MLAASKGYRGAVGKIKVKWENGSGPELLFNFSWHIKQTWTIVIKPEELPIMLAASKDYLGAVGKVKVKLNLGAVGKVKVKLEIGQGQNCFSTLADP